jgi:hypothetical protein
MLLRVFYMTGEREFDMNIPKNIQEVSESESGD